MRRISVFECEGGWTFAPGADLHGQWASMFAATAAAAAYGDSLEGEAAGYVIRLILPDALSPSTDNIIVHTVVFAGDAPLHSRKRSDTSGD